MNSCFKHFLFDTPQKKVTHSGVFSETNPLTPPKIVPLQGSIQFFPFSPNPNSVVNRSSHRIEEEPPVRGGNQKVFSLHSLATPGRTDETMNVNNDIYRTGFSPMRPFPTPTMNKSYCVEESDERQMLLRYRPLIEPPPHLIQEGGQGGQGGRDFIPPSTPPKTLSTLPISGEDVQLKPNKSKKTQERKGIQGNAKRRNRKKKKIPKRDQTVGKKQEYMSGGVNEIIDNLNSSRGRRYVLRNVIPPKKLMTSPKYIQVRMDDARKRRSKQRGYRYEEDEDFVMEEKGMKKKKAIPNQKKTKKKKKKTKRKKKKKASSEEDVDDDESEYEEEEEPAKRRSGPKKESLVFGLAPSNPSVIKSVVPSASSSSSSKVRRPPPPPIPERLSKNPYSFSTPKQQQHQQHRPLQRQQQGNPKQQLSTARILMNSPPPPKSIFKRQHQQKLLEQQRMKDAKRVSLKDEYVHYLQRSSSIQRRDQLHQSNRFKQRQQQQQQTQQSRFYTTAVNVNNTATKQKRRKRTNNTAATTTTATATATKKRKRRKSTMGMKQKLPRKKILQLAKKVNLTEAKVRERFHMNNSKHQRGTLPKKVLNELKNWFVENRFKPYPSMKEKGILMKKTGLSKTQIEDWFTNKRKRIWKPLIEDLLAESGIEY